MAIDRTDWLSIEQNSYRHFCHTHHDISWQIMTCHDITGYILIHVDKSWHIMTFCHKHKKHHFVAKARIYCIFVAKTYDYRFFDSFWGSAGFIDSPTSYAILVDNSPKFYNSEVIQARNGQKLGWAPKKTQSLETSRLNLFRTFETIWKNQIVWSQQSSKK